MSYARASLFYLATYLSLTGLAFLFVPQWALRLLGASQSYDPPFVQFTGAFMLALAVIVIQIIRLHLSMLHSTTIAVRLFFLVVIMWLFFETSDPLFLVVLAVVALGVVLTALGFAWDKQHRQ